mmetsp:Transcript_2207/g.6563  ORF Transcript_2207/g.6563 Transcript_2207/m.6563 type:complete len:188 (-) Transcript_2207:123-686(-)
MEVVQLFPNEKYGMSIGGGAAYVKGGTPAGMMRFKRRCMDDESNLDSEILHDNYRSAKRYLSSALASQMESMRLMEKSNEISKASEPMSETVNGNAEPMISAEVDMEDENTSEEKSTSKALVVYNPLQYIVNPRIWKNVEPKELLERMPELRDDRQFAIIPYEKPKRLEELRTNSPPAAVEEDRMDI